MQIMVHSVERYTPLDYTLGEDLYCTEPSPAGPHTAAVVSPAFGLDL